MSSRPRQFSITDIVPEEEARRNSAEKKETEARRKSEEEKEQRRIDEIKLLNNKIIEYQNRINQMERTAVSKITAAIKRFKVQKETKAMRKSEEEKEQRTAASKIKAAIKRFNVQKKARRKFEEEQINKDFWDGLEKKLNRVTI